MQSSRTPRRARAVAAGLATAVAIAGAGTALAAGERAAQRPTPAPPFTKRCAIEFRAYSDGSANIFCAERAKPFASVDAESGRIRFYR